jgi:hypothetical protein
MFLGKVTSEKTIDEMPLLEAAVSDLSHRLPPTWSAAVQAGSAAGQDQLLVVKSPSGMTMFLVEMLSELHPRDVQSRYGGSLVRRLRTAAPHQPLLIVAPALSVQTRTALRNEGVNYIDGTGNIWLRADSPSIVVDVERPHSGPRGRAVTVRGLSGAAVGRVMRVLIDGREPATLDAVARVAGISLGYCSRVASDLSDEALVERTAKGGIAKVEWEAIVRRRAEVSTLFRPGTTTQWVARHGVEECLARLEADPPGGLWCVTGSHAAARYAAVTAPRGLTVWVRPIDLDNVAHQLDLLPVDEGGDVRLIRASNYSPFDRVGDDHGSWWQRSPGAAYQGVRWAAPSQAAIDCLSGTGRMPEEGDALLAWMVDHAADWRQTPIAELPPPATDHPHP